MARRPRCPDWLIHATALAWTVVSMLTERPARVRTMRAARSAGGRRG